MVNESLNPTYPDFRERRLPQPNWRIMIKLSFQMTLPYEGIDYQLLLRVERDYGREPIAGEVVVFSSEGAPLAIRVLTIKWFPDFCVMEAEPAPDALTAPHRPTSQFDEFRRYVAAGFRCPWTGYPAGIPEPVDESDSGTR